jgi:hypothetical protein
MLTCLQWAMNCQPNKGQFPLHLKREFLRAFLSLSTNNWSSLFFIWTENKNYLKYGHIGNQITSSKTLETTCLSRTGT